ncbi:hypothetical protein [Paenibacillus chitinolyticus]|uniref:hypothetical protein n=1 Tax=Paenibacillus chitinolyticus TaxID=79263 RepID=UPI003672F85B
MDMKKILCRSERVLINEQSPNKVFLELDILLCRAQPNLNNYLFEESFIDEIVNNQKDYVGLPLVCDTEKLMNGDFMGLGHNYSPTSGLFFTEQIGSYYQFTKMYGEDGIAELHGTARISKRNSNLIDVLLTMYNSVGLSFSVEVVASHYSINDNILIIPSHPDNKLTADALVGFPACPDSQALRLVAELNNAIKKDKGVSKVKSVISELSHGDIRSQLSEAVNPTFDANGYRNYEYWIVAVYSDYFIVSDEKKSGVYYKYSYKVENDVVSLGEKSQVTIKFTALNSEGVNMENINVDVNELVKKNESLVLENEKLKNENQKMIAEKATIESQLNETNAAVVELGKEKEVLSAQVQELSEFKKDVVVKKAQSKIETMISEVKSDLSEEELRIVNEVAATHEVDKVQYKINEIIAEKYKEKLKLQSSYNNGQYFSVTQQKDLGADELSRFNM